MGVSFEFLPNARNIRRLAGLRVVYSSEEELEVPEEPNPITSAKWKPRKVMVRK